MTIGVLVVDGQQIFGEGLCAVLRKAPDIDVIGYVGNASIAMDLVSFRSLDVVIVDPLLLSDDVAKRMDQIGSFAASARVLCISQQSGVSFVISLLAAGAAGFVPKFCTVSELLAAVRTVQETGSYLSPHLTPALFASIRTNGASSAALPPADLTARERETLMLIAEGYSTKQIANNLSVSEKTVGSHRKNLMDKLGIHSVAGLTKYAIRAGMTTPDDPGYGPSRAWRGAASTTRPRETDRM